ncbi:MAG: TlpA family protein disulfide reductase [Candidatus Eisenbacteria bacterium]|nr:TlpA family protein disulfide reductase [Candidatus Eisenbacteria bacterium]
MIKHVLAPALITLLFLAPACSKQEEKGNPSAPAAPEFAVNAVDDNRVIHLTDYRGKVLVLNFWATWCPPCKMEIPAFNELYKEYQGDGLEFLGVSVDQGGLDAVNSYLASGPNNPAVPGYPVAMANDGIVRAFHAIQPLGSIPTTFIIDRKGRIQKIVVGSREKSEFESMVTALL